MTRGDLIERLSKYEWSDVEFKEARDAAPRSAYETVSAFANTSGGWLVFGVRDRGGTLDVVGVMQVDKVQNEFLSTLRSRQKINRAIGVAADAVETDDMTLLVFHIPESPRGDKPVYLDGDTRRSYIRRDTGDERCTPEEIERFLRDASQDRYDGEPLELDPEEFFDPESVRWYRILDAAQLGQSTSDQVREGAEGLVSDQPGRPDSRLITPALTNLTDDQRTIIMLCEVPRKQADPHARG